MDQDLQWRSPTIPNRLTETSRRVHTTGTFHMEVASDEDLSYALTARNKSVSISGFWMDTTGNYQQRTPRIYKMGTRFNRSQINGLR